MVRDTQDGQTADAPPPGNTAAPAGTGDDSDIRRLGKTAAGRGELFVEQGVWLPSGPFSFPASPVKMPPDWHADPHQNRSWVFLYHQFSFCPDLLAYDAASGTDRGLNCMLQIVRDWWRHFAEPASAPDFAWHDHGAALRAMNLLEIRRRVAEDDAETRAFLDHVLAAHAAFLSDEANYTRGTNHGLDQSLALFRLAVAAAGADWAGPARALAASRIDAEIGTAFAPDGGHRENSTGYHMFGLQQLMKVRKAIRPSPDDLPERLARLDAMIERATEILIQFFDPLGKFPQIGDTARKPLPNLFASAEDRPECYRQYLYALTAGRKGRPPRQTFMVLPEAGWISMRDHWAGPHAVHLLAHCGYSSHYHRHDDDHTFTLTAFGEDWVIDGGLYKYHEKDPYRRYLRSCKAHSISMPVNENALRNKDMIGNCARIESAWSQAGLYHAACSSRMFAGFHSTRSFTFNAREPGRPARIRISDCIRPQGDEAMASRVRALDEIGHSYTSRFMIPGDKQVELCPGGGRAIVSAGDRRMTIQATGEITGLRAVRGQQEPEPDGWRSTGFGTIEPATMIEFQSGGIDAILRFDFTWENYAQDTEASA